MQTVDASKNERLLKRRMSKLLPNKWLIIMASSLFITLSAVAQDEIIDATRFCQLTIQLIKNTSLTTMIVLTMYSLFHYAVGNPIKELCWWLLLMTFEISTSIFIDIILKYVSSINLELLG